MADGTPRRSWLVWLPPLVFVALAGLFAGALAFRDDTELPSALIGQPAPALPATALRGSLDLGPGVTVVNFFASWCAPCRVEHPVLQAYADEGVHIVGIAYKDDPAKAEAFLDELGDPFRGVGLDPDGQVAVNWGTYGVPETFVVAADGTVVARMATPLTPEIAEARLRPALDEAAAR